MECFPFSRTPILRAQLTDDTHPLNQTHATLVSFACRVGEELASRAREAVSGSSSRESFASFDPASSSWKTSQLSLAGGLEPFSETWPRSGLMRSGIAYRLTTLAPISKEIGSGYWPTPRAAKRGARSHVTAAAKLIADGRSRHHRLEDALVCADGKTGLPNPAWVEWLMGFPAAWTDLLPLATPSSPKSPS